MKALTSLAILLLAFRLVGQMDTELYLFDLTRTTEGEIVISNPLNISSNPGYDNQPYFWPDGNSLLYARNKTSQTEIARYFIGSGKTQLISKTLQGSEYSPTVAPDGSISSIRLDTTGLQRLYTYQLDGDHSLLVENLVIGYYCWLSKNKIAAFILGDPNTLQIVDLKSSKSREVAQNPGRSLHLLPFSKELSFVDKKGENWTIKILNIKNGKMRDIVRARQGSEDFCWTPTGEILMGENNELWVWSPFRSWRMVEDLSKYGLKNVTRLAVSKNGDKLVAVVEKQDINSK
ncbi:MAG: hypothetical protein AAF616_03570 [Bacteroidota bacterium]